jgi:hypothetical protein
MEPPALAARGGHEPQAVTSLSGAKARLFRRGGARSKVAKSIQRFPAGRIGMGNGVLEAPHIP